MKSNLTYRKKGRKSPHDLVTSQSLLITSKPALLLRAPSPPPILSFFLLILACPLPNIPYIHPSNFGAYQLCKLFFQQPHSLFMPAPPFCLFLLQRI